MVFKKTTIEGAYTLSLDRYDDDRGFFARMYCKDEFLKHGVDFNPVQINNAYSKKKDTIRGIHYQSGADAESKLVRCVKGEILDVIIDLRPVSSTYLNWESFSLSANNREMLYVPTGCAHGYQTLTDDTEIIYLVSAFYNPAAEKGIRWNDPLFKVKWVQSNNIIISDKDRSWADFNPE